MVELKKFFKFLDMPAETRVAFTNAIYSDTGEIVPWSFGEYSHRFSKGVNLAHLEVDKWLLKQDHTLQIDEEVYFE